LPFGQWKVTLARPRQSKMQESRRLIADLVLPREDGHF